MAAPVSVLLSAHADTGAGRFLTALKAGGYAPRAVLASTDEDFAAALAQERWDVVIVVPGTMPVSAAIEAVRAAHPGVPVVIAEAPAGAESRLRAAGADAVVAAGELERLGEAVSTVLVAAAPPPVGVAPGSDPRALAVQDLAEHLPIGLYQTRPDGRIVYANEALPIVLGFDSREDLADIDVRRDIGYPREHFEAQMARFGSVRNLVVRWTDRQGRTVYTREHARAVRDAEGEVSYFEGTMEDVTAEYAAREREVRRTQQFATIVRFATDVDDVENVDDVYSAAVSAAEAVTGAPRIVLAIAGDAGVTCVASSDAVTEEGLSEASERGLLAKVPLGSEAVLVPDLSAYEGDEVDAEVVAFMIERGVAAFAAYPLIYHGSTRGALLLCFDQPHAPAAEEVQVTQTLAWHVAGALARHHAEAGLRGSEACLRFIDRHTDHVLFRLRYGAEPGSPTFDYLSPAVEVLVGYTPQELETEGGLTALVEEREVLEGDGLTDGPPPPEAFQGDGAPPRYVARYRMRTRSGETRWVENVAYVWTEADGHPVGLVGTLVDVTERKHREEARAAEAARTLELQRTLVELGALGSVEPEDFIRRVTEAAAAAIGVDRALVRVIAEDGVGHCLDLYDAGDGAHVAEADMPAEQFGAWLDEHGRSRSIALSDTLVDPRALSASADHYFRQRDIGALLSAAIRHQGRVVGVLSLHHVGGPRAWTAGDLEFAAALADLLALALERAERLRAESALREQELRYRAVSELTSDYAFAVRIHPDGRDEIDWATGAFSRVTGYATDEIDAIEGLLSLFHPDCTTTVRNALALLDAGESVDFEGRLRTKTGEERWVRHRARPGAPAPDGTVVHYHGGEDVTDRKRFEQELIAAREQAEEMARLKSAFLANMSHEIRTPLTGILGYAGILADEVTDPEHRESVEFIERCGNRLLETLDSVLELARLEASGVRPQVEVLDIVAEVRQSALLLAPVADSKGLELAVIAGAAPACSRLDRTCLARIMTNLMGNAIKFTEAGSVEVEVRADETHAHIRISDTGVGIDPRFLPRIFDEFRQESDGDARNHEGAGLGLAITRRLVDVLGGAVSVESEKGVGTSVTVTFPLHEPADSDAAASEDAESLAPVRFVLSTPRPPALAGPDVVLPEMIAPESQDAPDAFESETDDAPFEVDSEIDRVSEEPEREPEPEPAALPQDIESQVDELVADDEHDPGAEEEALEALELEAGSLVADSIAAAAVDEFGLELPETAGSEGLLDLIYPPDEPSSDDGFRLSWDDEEPPDGQSPAHSDEGDGSWFAPADTDLEALFAPAATLDAGAETGDGREAPDENWFTTVDIPSRDDVELAIPPPLPPITMDAALPEGPGSGLQSPPDTLESAPATQGPAVLVVEDNSDTRALLERILRSGYTTFAVGDARSALDLLHRERFDALILDINLGGRETGVDVLRIARSLPGNDALFAIALTAYALPGDRERFLEAGFDQYVSKPFTRSTLLTALREGLGEPKA